MILSIILTIPQNLKPEMFTMLLQPNYIKKVHPQASTTSGTITNSLQI
jgi:hypothetical protein